MKLVDVRSGVAKWCFRGIYYFKHVEEAKGPQEIVFIDRFIPNAERVIFDNYLVINSAGRKGFELTDLGPFESLIVQSRDLLTVRHEAATVF